MDAPEMSSTRLVAPDTVILPGHLPVPGMGVLAVNAYLIRAAEPVLVDAGLGALREDFLRALEQTIDLEDLRWIYVTHTDPDHIGSLGALLERAPRARVVTTYVGMGKLSMIEPIAPDRVFLLNPGQSLDVGDRWLTAIRPPTFDAPETTGLFDQRTRALFSSDCFGAVIAGPHEAAGSIDPDELRDGMITWAGVDAPWLHSTRERAFERALEAVRRLDPSVVLSSHLPPASGRTSALLEHLRSARAAEPFVGPDQVALLEMLAAA